MQGFDVPCADIKCGIFRLGGILRFVRWESAVGFLLPVLRWGGATGRGLCVRGLAWVYLCCQL